MASKPNASKRGRPTIYTPELAEKICDLIREGMSERQICKMPDMPPLRTLQDWKDRNPEFSQQSARAREESAALYREKALDIAQATANTAVRALRGEITDALGETVKDLPRGYVEAQKLLVQELNREAALRDDRNYGDRRRVAVTGPDGGAIKLDATPDLSDVDLEKLKAVKEMLYGNSTADTDRT